MYSKSICDQWQAAIDVIEHLNNEVFFQSIGHVVECLVDCYRKKGRVFVFGNGGSATDADHISAELVGRFKRSRSPLSAIALTTSGSVLTAWANDYDFESIFSRQLEAHGRRGDVAWGISTSGNSPNVVSGLRVAKDIGLKTIGFLGNDGGQCKHYCDCVVLVDEKETPRIQEAHMIAYHVVCSLVEEIIFSYD